MHQAKEKGAVHPNNQASAPDQAESVPKLSTWCRKALRVVYRQQQQQQQQQQQGTRLGQFQPQWGRYFRFY
jgi:hypothetical protein